MRTRVRGSESRRGSALATSLFVALTLSAVLASIMVIGVAHKTEVSSAMHASQALYLADAGVSEGILEIAAAGGEAGAVPTDLWSDGAPLELKNGDLWCSIDDNVDGTFTIRSTGRSGLHQRVVEAVVAPVGGSVFDHAIFAGNTSGDPAYELVLGGEGSQADEIVGNIYSGGDISVTGDAGITGEVHAVGGIAGSLGLEGIAHPVPDIVGMDYENNHDYNVAAMFASDSSWQSNALGGSAYELPEANPAHIFRLNPDDRTDETVDTAKDDYFLEDPYMPVKDFTAPETGKQGHTITLSGVSGYPGESGTDKVYYVDGNLWVHNKPFGRLRFFSDGGEKVKVTFVVRGNVYFCDDVYIVDDYADGVAFIAVKDDKVDDSGNIYLGDPRYGTLDMMETFLYAENDFIDNNLSASGSKKIEIIGNMTAGNHVAIERDYVHADGSVDHSKLTVEFDNRISTGDLVLPGLPTASAGVEGYEVVFWRVAGEE
ncbi:MAG: hypothetical protein AAF682_00905 [Planctomycetota bacterium]